MPKRAHETINTYSQSPEFSGITFERFIEEFGALCPEVGAQPAQLANAAGMLIDTYQPSPDFYNAKDNATGLLFAAALSAEASITDGRSATRIARETEIATNFSHALFGSYSAKYPHEDLVAGSELDPQARLAVYRRYQDAGLSESLQSWFMSSPEIATTRRELGIDAKNHPSFEVIVLSAAHPLHTKNTKLPKEYKRLLHVRGEQFMRDQLAPLDDELPRAWATTLDGQQFICITEPLARIILDPRSMLEAGDERYEQTLNLARHEIVHAWGEIGLTDENSPTKKVFLGDMLEEFRAEVFSGMKMGRHYPDIAPVMRDIKLTTGTDVADIMKSLPNGGANNKGKFYAKLAAGMGVVPAAMLVSLLPKAYLSWQSPKSSRNLHSILGEGGSCALGQQLFLRASEEQIKAYLNRRDIACTPEILVQFEELKQELG